MRPSSTAGIVAEHDHTRAEGALSAYCRELCGPASDRAVAAILGVLEEGPGRINEADLLRTTRATAAGFAFAGMDGSRGKLTATLSKACAPTPRRLAASASRLLVPQEEHELTAHLQDCLPCNAIRIKHDRAERGFAVLWGCPATSESHFAFHRSPTLLAAEPPPPPIEEAAQLLRGQAQAAAQAYCRELCGPDGWERAAAACLRPLETVARSRTVPADELLRVTRSAAAKQAATGIGARVARDSSAAECAAMTVALAELANGEIGGSARRQLQAHIQGCLVCHATQIKMSRAQRAFATMAAAEPDLEAWFDLAAPPQRERAAPDASPRRTAPQASPRRAAAASALAAASAAPIPAAAPHAPAPNAPAPRAPRPATSPPAPRLPVDVAALERQQRFRRRRLVAAAAMVLTVVAVAAVVVLSGRSSAPTASSAALARLSRSAHVSPVPAHAPATTVSPAAKAKPVRPKVAAKVHRAAKAKPVHHAVKVVHRTVAPKHTAPAVSAPPVHVAAPTAPARVVSAPVTRKATPAAPAKPSTPSVTPQGSDLPAQSAPTKGIGGG